MTTTSHRTAAEVVVVDLRDGGNAMAQVAGLVVVIDDATALLAHEAVYDRLVNAKEVHHLLCVVVGEAVDREGDGVLLEVPGPLVFGRCTILWVGHEHGVRWSPAENYPMPVPAEFPSGLDHLVEALRVPEVFAQVRAVIENFVGNAASPGTVLVSGAVDAEELAQARAMVVQRLTGFDPDAPLPPPLADPVSFASDGALPPGILGGRAEARRNEAFRWLQFAQETKGVVRGWAPLFRRSNDNPAAGDPNNQLGRPGEKLGAQVRLCASAAEAYRQHMTAVLHDIDGNLRVGRPPADAVTRAGVRPPTQVNPSHVAGQVAKLVADAGARRYSMSTLAAQLRHAAAIAAPQGCAPEADALANHPEITRAKFPAFRALPLWGWTAPLILLTTLALALLPLPGWTGGVLAVVFALLWFGTGWFLLARRPNDDGHGDLGFPDALQQSLLVYGLPGALGAAAGIWLADLIRGILPVLDQIPPRFGWSVVIGAVVLYLAVVLPSWPTAARRWVRGMKLDALQRELRLVDTTAEDGIKKEWLPSQRRRMVADAFVEAAAALQETSDVLAHSSPEGPGTQHDGYAAPGGLRRMVLGELLDVVGADLVAVSLQAMAPAWVALSSGGRNSAGTYGDEAKDVLRRYQAHITRHGLLVAPPIVGDSGPRDRLLDRRWGTSQEAETALRTQVSGEMVQLCQARHLDWIDGQVPPKLVRFAPHPVQRVLQADAVRNKAILEERPIWTSAGEMAGALRLVPLRDMAIKRVGRG